VIRGLRSRPCSNRVALKSELCPDGYSQEKISLEPGREIAECGQSDRSFNFRPRRVTPHSNSNSPALILLAELNMAFSLNCRQLHPDPDLGPLKHDHKLTLIFFSEGDSQNPWIKRGDPTVIWPRDWLPKEEGLGDNILVLSVECYVDPKTAPSVPLERILVRDLVMKYVCSHLNALLGSFLGVVASWGSTCDLIMLAVCFAVYVLPYTHFR
jgi:hypothetical protein